MKERHVTLAIRRKKKIDKMTKWATREGRMKEGNECRARRGGKKV